MQTLTHSQSGFDTLAAELTIARLRQEIEQTQAQLQEIDRLPDSHWIAPGRLEQLWLTAFWALLLFGVMAMLAEQTMLGLLTLVAAGPAIIAWRIAVGSRLHQVHNQRQQRKDAAETLLAWQQQQFSHYRRQIER